MYNVIDTTICDYVNFDAPIGDDDNAGSHLDADSDGTVNEVLYDGKWDKRTKFELVHKCWETLNNFNGSMALIEAMRHHLYRLHFGNEANITADNIVEGYNPLNI